MKRFPSVSVRQCPSDCYRYFILRIKLFLQYYQITLFIFIFQRFILEREGGSGREGEEKRDSHEDFPLSTERDTGLDPMTLKTRTQAKIKSPAPNRLSCPGAPHSFYFL